MLHIINIISKGGSYDITVDWTNLNTMVYILQESQSVYNFRVFGYKKNMFTFNTNMDKWVDVFTSEMLAKG